MKPTTFGGDRPWPDYGGGSLPNLAASIYQHLGGSDRDGRAAPLDSTHRIPLDGVETVILLLVDGLGWQLLTDLTARGDRMPHSRLLHRLREEARPLQSVFPSTTSAAMASLVTAHPPARHGIVGKQVYLSGPQRTVNLHAPATGDLTTAIRGKSPRAKSILWEPTLFDSGLRTVVLTRVQFAPSIFTAVLFRGASTQFYVSLGDMSDSLRNVVLHGAGKGPRLILVYWDALDTMLHVFGNRRAATAEEVGSVVGATLRSLRGLPSRVARTTQLIVIGDHGHVDVRPRGVRRIDGDPKLKSLLAREAVGERRAIFLAARRGAESRLSGFLGRSLPSSWTVAPVARAIDGGLLGPPAAGADLETRLGTFLVRPGNGSVWLNPPALGNRTWVPRAAHGGLSPEEMRVPLISLTMDQVERF